METLNVTTANPLISVLSLRDPRTRNWETLENPTYMLVILASYLYVSKSLGPRYMKHRDPYELKGAIMIYNLFQVLANMYFLSQMIYHTFYAAGYSPFCQGLTYSTDPHAISLLNVLFWYLWVRVADFLDTLFFVLKKKFTHITVLHVLHHTLVVFGGWMFLQFGGDGQAVFGVCLNSFVHIIMYIYYFLACLGPSVQKYLWWKRYLTRLQIGHFVVIIAHASIPMFVDCGYPRVLIYIAIPQVILILGLFVNFYVQSYIKRRNVGADKMTKTCLVQSGAHPTMINGVAKDADKKKV
ncbi:elongation of very long chain fatty acids protein 4-like [Ixodes scapularis]|uniref:elongation of very long chain fatty acids protein 4-like n=1 Tax=Ixodes scapularis TaxID=6945 RepID=UPI001A9D9CEE|nr:elongation of very long chain fatty acids protein 4-like [Ixodes scapularis]